MLKIGAVIAAAAFAVFIGFVVLAGAAVSVVAGGAQGVSPRALTLLWLPAVQQPAQAAGIPSALELGVLQAASGGNYLTVKAAAGGTTDAGLGQINSGASPADAGWTGVGLTTSNPYTPAANIAASIRLLAGDVTQANGSVTAGLDTYAAMMAGLGGTPSATFASDVLSAASGFEAGPVLDAWPVGGQQKRGTFGFIGGGTWLAPAVAGTGQTWVIVTAAAPAGASRQYGGQTWTGLVTPSSVTATVNGSPVTARPSGAAPKALQQATPPDSSFWWLPVPVSTSGTTQVQIVAAWTYTVTTTNTVPYACGHRTCYRTAEHQQTKTKTTTTTLAAKEEG